VRDLLRLSSSLLMLGAWRSIASASSAARGSPFAASSRNRRTSEGALSRMSLSLFFIFRPVVVVVYGITINKTVTTVNKKVTYFFREG